MERQTSKNIIAVLIHFVVFIIVSCTLPITIHRAAMNGNVMGIQQRLDMGDNVNLHDRFGWTPLLWAVYYNQLNAVKYLLSRGADPNGISLNEYGSFQKGTTPLMLCAYYDYRVIASLLIASGADIHAKDRFGNTALTYAELNNLLEMMNFLGNAANKNRNVNQPKGGQTKTE